MTQTIEQLGWLRRLSASRAQLLAAAHAGRIDLTELERIANDEVRSALMLTRVSLDPVARLRAAHIQARPYLQRLIQHDPAVQVIVDTTHSYTPRKILRRVLDHALDHLNQIEQWLTWQANGVAPTPTDGWASSAVMFAEDCMPLSAAELDAWRWRIDLAVEIVAQRAAQLSPAQLHWTPPGGGWSLLQVLHHLAAAEGYYVIWLDAALPEATVERYAVASQRVCDRLNVAFDAPEGLDMVFYDDEIGLFTPEQIAHQVLDHEQRLLVATAALE